MKYGLVGPENGKFLLRFSTILADIGGWFRKGPNMSRVLT